MRKRVVIMVLCAAALFVAGETQAQASPSNPLDIVPDVMPFDVPYGPPIAVARARSIIAAAAAEAQKRNWKMNIAVVDSGGNLVAFERMDGAQLASIAVSEHKARVAAAFRRETKVFENGIQLSNLHYLLTLDGIIASRGGIPLVEALSAARAAPARRTRSLRRSGRLSSSRRRDNLTGPPPLFQYSRSSTGGDPGAVGFCVSEARDR